MRIGVKNSPRQAECRGGIYDGVSCAGKALPVHASKLRGHVMAKLRTALRQYNLAAIYN